MCFVAAGTHDRKRVPLLVGTPDRKRVPLHSVLTHTVPSLLPRVCLAKVVSGNQTGDTRKSILPSNSNRES